MTDHDRKELEKLRALDHVCSMGDRPISMSMRNLRRLMALEAKERKAKR